MAFDGFYTGGWWWSGESELDIPNTQHRRQQRRRSHLRVRL
jgi:hypothetical protein